MRISRAHRVVAAVVVTTVAASTAIAFTADDDAKPLAVAALPSAPADRTPTVGTLEEPERQTEPEPEPERGTAPARPTADRSSATGSSDRRSGPEREPSRPSADPPTTDVEPTPEATRPEPGPDPAPAPTPTPTPRQKNLLEVLLGP